MLFRYQRSWGDGVYSKSSIVHPSALAIACAFGMVACFLPVSIFERWLMTIPVVLDNSASVMSALSLTSLMFFISVTSLYKCSLWAKSSIFSKMRQHF